MTEPVHGGRHEPPPPRLAGVRRRHPDDLDPAKDPILPGELQMMAEAYLNEDAARLAIERGHR